MQTPMIALFASLMSACAVGVATPDDGDVTPNSDGEYISSTQEALRVGRGPGGGGGSLGIKCSDCTSNYDDCLVDAGGDSELIGWCNWERGVCNRHCDGWIIAVQR